MMRRLLTVVAFVTTLVVARLAPLPAAGPGVVLVADGEPLCGIEGDPIPGSGSITVATFNLLHSATEEGDRTLGARLELEADALHVTGADIVGLQEVTRNDELGGGEDPANPEFPQRHGTVAQRLAAELAERTGGGWYWCWSWSNPHFPGTPDTKPGGGNPVDEAMVQGGAPVLRGPFREGLAILSRYPITEARFRRLLPRSYEAAACVPPNPFDCNLSAVFDSRQLLHARVATPFGPMDAFTTHIAHELTPLSDATKHVQVRQALALIAQWSDPATPDVFTGDFNSDPGSDRIQAVVEAGFADTWLAAGRPECPPGGGFGCTGDPSPGQEVFTDSDQRQMGRRIDYLFSRGCTAEASDLVGTAAQQVSVDPPRWLWPSDHLGVSSSLQCTWALGAGTTG